MAILDGLDTIVFIADDLKGAREWTLNFLKQMQFLGLNVNDHLPATDAMCLSSDNSRIKACYLDLNRWSLMSELLTGQQQT